MNKFLFSMFILSLFLCLVLFNCNLECSENNLKNLNNNNRPDSILYKKYKIQYLTINSFNDFLSKKNLLTQIKELEKFEKWAIDKRDIQLQLIVKLYKIKKTYENAIKNNQDTNKAESLYINNIKYIISQSNTKNLLPIKTQAYEMLAEHYWNSKKYTESLENSLNSFNIYDNISVNNFPQKSDYLYDFVNKYYYFRDFENAKKYSLKVWNELPLDKITNIPSKLNTLGLCYFQLNKIDSSNYYFLKALEYSTKNKLNTWIGIICGNLGSNYLKENKTKEAIFYFEKCIEIETKYKLMIDLAINLSKYGEALLLENKPKEALDAQLKSLKILHEKGIKDIKITYLIFPNIANAFAANGNVRMAYKYLDSGFIAKSKFESERNSLFLSGFQHKIDIEKHNTELKKNEAEIKIQKFVRNLMIFGFILLLLVSMIFYFQQRKFRKTQLKLFLSEKLAVLGQVSAGVAHEVNTPLSAIKSSSEESLNSFPELIDDLLWITKNLNKNEMGMLFEFISVSNNINKILTTKEEREIKKNTNLKLTELGIKNSRFISEKLIQVGIYEVNSKLIELSKLPDFEKLILFICQFLNQQKSHRTIQIAVNKASRIVKALKTYIHNPNSEQKELINLKENLETVLTIYQNRLKQGIQVIKNYDEIPDIYGYPDQLNQVWTNLIVNAVQAMDNNGILTLTLVSDDQYVILSIKDTGKGIPKKIQSKIYEPFFTTKQSGEGSGIGLDITRRILKEHSALITFDSIENEGTTFFVKIPFPKSKAS